MKLLRQITIVTLLVFFIQVTLNAQRSIYDPIDIDKVEFSFDDFGTMWTFDAVPKDDYKNKLGFSATDKWLDDVQKSALELGNGCSASFVSADGLIMTNHHCVRGKLKEIEKEGEDLYKDGYYAENLKDERTIPGLFADQLMEIKDVTNVIHKAMDKGEDDNARIAIKEKKIQEIEAEYSEKTGLQCKVITLYTGGKYSLHMYKRYKDIRLVMAPDVQIAATGWDWDNFTYPRYELDFAFLRAYDEKGNPVKVTHFFEWSEKGAETNEAVFVIGRPGNTDRLLSMSELEFFRDLRHPQVLNRLNQVYFAYYEYFMNNPDRQSKLLSRLLSVANGRKAYAGMLMGLNDDYLMKKKYDFEAKLKEKVKADPKLNKKYGNVWNDIENLLKKSTEIENQILHLGLSHYHGSSYQKTAQALARLSYSKSARVVKADEYFFEAEEEELQKLLIIAHEGFLRKVKGDDYKYLSSLYGNKQGQEALNFFLENTQVDDRNFVVSLAEKGPKAIINSSDPMIQYAIAEYELSGRLKKERKELGNKLAVLNQKLGLLIFEAYGDKIPPDATSSLRISHGKLKGYEYNGTLAPAKTTYYGLWDRYYSFGEETYPWGLHERWQKVPKGLELSTAIGFASTNDIVGGNSGSAVINKNAEVVGLVHDGNLESLVGSYAYLGEDNRSVATDSYGLFEALRLVYKTERLIYELSNGKMK